MRKWLKYIIIGFTGIILLLAGLVAFTQTRLFKDWLRDEIVLEAGKQLNGSLEIGRIDGNLISDFLISRLALKDQQDTLLYLQKLAVQLRPHLLFSRQIVLKIVSIDSPRVILRQRPDSLWNVATLVAESQTDSAKAEETTSWQFALENIAVKNAAIRIFPIARIPALPQRIAGLNANLSLAYRQNIMSLDLKDLHLNTRQPDLAIQKFSLASTLKDSTLSLKNLMLHLRKTRVDADCELHLTAIPDYRFRINAEPLSLDEIAQISSDLQLAGNPVIALQGHFRGDSLHFKINITEGSRKLYALGNVCSLKTTPVYDISGSLENMDFSQWYSGIDSSLSHRLNGDFSLRGRGHSAASAKAKFKIDLANSRFQQFELDDFELAGKYDTGKATFDIELKDQRSQITLSGKIDDVLAGQQLDLTGRLDHVDAGKLLAIDSMQTDINMRFLAKVRGLNPDSLLADVQLYVAPSQVAGVAIDTLFCVAHIQNDDFAIDTLQIESALGDFYLAGMVSLASENDLRFRGDVGDLRWVAAKVGADTLQMKGAILGRIQGKMEYLSADLGFDLREISYNTFRIDSLHCKSGININAGNFDGKLTGNFHNAGTAKTRLDSVSVHADFSNNTADIEIALSEGSDLLAQSRLHFLADTTSRLDISEIRIRFKNREWKNTKSNATLLMAADAYQLHNFVLVNSDQQIAAHGALRPHGQQDFHFDLSGIDIPQMMELTGTSLTGVEGKLNLNSHLTGALEAPKLSAKLQVQNGRLTKVEYDSLNIDLDYEDAVLTWLFKLYMQNKLALRGDGYLPIDAMAADSAGMIDTKKPFRFQIATQGIDLSFLQPFLKDIKNLQGLFVCDVRIENTLSDPEPVGHLSVFNGAISFPQYGMKYKDIQARLHVDKESIRVTELDVGTEIKVVKGFRRTRGKEQKEQEEMSGRLWLAPGSYIAFDSTGFLGGVDSMNLNIKANEFQLANSSNFQAQISGDVKVFGNAQAPNFDGTMRVLRSSLYLPALEETGLYDEARMKSLLAGVEFDSVAILANEDDTDSTAYFDNLRGRLKIEMPKNTWVRGPDMNIELSGAFDLVKDGPEFEQPFG
ncbi:MAG: translocation/assembly module TamB domain-containing protein, partial [bacterium]